MEPSEPVEPPALAPEMSAFTLPDPLPEMPFADVLADRWYYDAVHQAYAMSLMNGVSMSLFFSGWHSAHQPGDGYGSADL